MITAIRSIISFFKSVGAFLLDSIKGILGLFQLATSINVNNYLSFLPATIVSIVALAVSVVIILRITNRNN